MSEINKNLIQLRINYEIVTNFNFVFKNTSSSMTWAMTMNKLLATITSAFLLCAATSALAATEYNAIPAGDKQYAACISYSNKNYEGGNEKSPVKGQSKAQAFCSCMWNETPDDFRGSLAKFAETSKGKSTNKLCEEHADWGN
jgi:phosphoserine aminotransferase